MQFLSSFFSKKKTLPARKEKVTLTVRLKLDEKRSRVVIEKSLPPFVLTETLMALSRFFQLDKLDTFLPKIIVQVDIITKATMYRYNSWKSSMP